MTNTDRVQMLEALLERVRRNRSAAPHRATAAAPVTKTPPMPPIAPTAATPPSPPVAAYAPPVEAPPLLPAAWQGEPGSAVQPRPGTMPPESMAPESMPAEEIGEDDLLEVTTIPPDAMEAAPEAPREPRLSELPVLEPDTMEVSEITAVGVRISAGSLDEALAGAVQLEGMGEGEALEGEREVPIHTPPPESGPQEALPPTGLEAARMPDVDQLEADLISPPSLGPTAEQLGETIELEAPRGPELEIDVNVEETPPPPDQAPHEELEVALPRPSLPSGLYDLTTPPPGDYPSPALAEGPPSVPEPRETATIPVEVREDTGPERTGRPALGATDVAQVTLAAPASPKTFVELLDASLLV